MNCVIKEDSFSLRQGFSDLGHVVSILATITRMRDAKRQEHRLLSIARMHKPASTLSLLDTTPTDRIGVSAIELQACGRQGMEGRAAAESKVTFCWVSWSLTTTYKKRSDGWRSKAVSFMSHLRPPRPPPLSVLSVLNELPSTHGNHQTA